jgi:hypothetical protein
MRRRRSVVDARRAPKSNLVGPGAILAQQPHHVVIVLRRRGPPTDHPVEKFGIGAFQQRLELSIWADSNAGR